MSHWIILPVVLPAMLAPLIVPVTGSQKIPSGR